MASVFDATMTFKTKLRDSIPVFGSLLFRMIPGRLSDGRLRRSVPVKRRGREVFRIRDLGALTRMRAETFESKEPETLTWIEGFGENDTMLDVGANVGIYSLYAASRGCRVVAAEPDALNFALLNENLRLNNDKIGGKLHAYPVAFHDTFRISTLNVSSAEWGAALSSFDNAIDYKGDRFQPLFSQGCVGLCMDDFLSQIDFSPNHIKIDVDGNEMLVIRGASRCLESPNLKSVLVELDERRPDYAECIASLQSAGLALVEKSQSVVISHSPFAQSYNHIFRRRKS